MPRNSTPSFIERRGRSPHKRNTGPMHDAPRCGARTRDGGTCKAPRMQGRPCCRMHGGAYYAGARPGNRNALKHGRYSAQEALRRRVLRWAAEGDHLSVALAEALETAPAWPRPADVPDLFDLVTGNGIETYDARTLALADGGLGLTVWRHKRGYSVAFHRLDATQARLLARQALPTFAVLMASDDPAHRLEPGPLKLSFADGLYRFGKNHALVPVEATAAEDGPDAGRRGRCCGISQESERH